MAIAYIVVAVGFILMFWIAFSDNGADNVIGEDRAEVRYSETQELMDEIEEGSDDYNRP